MSIHNKIATLKKRLCSEPEYRTQGAVVFVDLENESVCRAWLPRAVMTTFLANRGANMYLLYNLMQEGKEALDPETPLIFGAGTLTGMVPGATRGNVTSISPDSRALLDSSCGDYFPSYMRHHAIDHIVLYGCCSSLRLIRIADGKLSFHDAESYRGMNNIEFGNRIESDFNVRERKDMAMARITAAGENQVLCSGIMGGPKAIWARGGAGAKMGSMQLKAIMITGRPVKENISKAFKRHNRLVSKKILGSSVTKNALKKVGTPFLYKPSRVLGAIGAKNNQETTWHESLDADNFDPYRPGMDGCYKCPVACRALNDMTPGGKGGWGANALKGRGGNASYDLRQSDVAHVTARTYNGINDDGLFDQYDKGDGPEYVTVGKMGANLGIKVPEQVLRLNNILNDLGLDSASTGSAIAWAMELYQRGIINNTQTGGLDLQWGDYPLIERLLFMTARRQGFGDILANSARAIERGNYPEKASDYLMAAKGLFQSDPHDSRILKAFALGLAVATRGMDHLRNRVTLEINARINDDEEFKTTLYGGKVAAEPNAYEGKENAVFRCETTYAAGDSVGMCRFNTKLFNSPSLPDCDDFAHQLHEITGIAITDAEVQECGHNVTGLEHMINFRLGLRSVDDTLPNRWFDEQNTFGPFKGEYIDRGEFLAMKKRYYQLVGLNDESLPQSEWHRQLSQATTGFSIDVILPTSTPGAPESRCIIDEPVSNVYELRQALARRLPEAVDVLSDRTLGFTINDEPLLHSEKQCPVQNGDRVILVPVMAGG